MAEVSRPPVNTTPVIEANNTMTRSWYRALQNLFRWVFNVQQLAVISTADVAAAADVTANPIASTDPTAAGVGYLQATAATWVTLIQELKTDVNTLTTQINLINAQLTLNATLTNELKTRLNAINSALNT